MQNQQVQMQNQQYIQEDEIDLRELFRTIWKKRLFILLFTGVVTLGAVAYALLDTPIYEGKAILEIGFFNSGGKKELIDDTNRLSQELNVVFIDSLRTPKGEIKEAGIKSIDVLKKNKDFIEVVGEGIANDPVVAEIQKVIGYIQERHQKNIDEKIKGIESSIKGVERQIEQVNKITLTSLDDRIKLLKTDTLKNLDDRIKLLKTDTLKNLDDRIKLLKTDTLKNLDERLKLLKDYSLPVLDQKVAILKSDIKKYEDQLKITEQNIQQTQGKDPSLSALSIMEKRDIQNRILNTRLQMLDLEKSKEDILINQLPQLQRDRDKLLNVDLEALQRDRDKLLNVDLEALQRDRDKLLNVDLVQLERERERILGIELVQLQEKVELLKLSIAPYNYHNTRVVANILTNDFPIKPKKKLIVTVAAVSGFILAIFMVFFMEFVQGFNKPSEEAVS